MITAIPKTYRTAIAYAPVDARIAWTLAEGLRSRRVEVMIPADHPGEKLARWIRNTVPTCDRLIVICSKAALAEGFVATMINIMLAREFDAGGDEMMIPVLFDIEPSAFKGIEPWNALGSRVPIAASHPRMIQRVWDALICPAADGSAP